MLKNRRDLEKFLIKYITNTSDAKIRKDWYIKLEQKYNIPISLSSDIISMRKDFSEYNEFILYAITDIIKPDKINLYFSDKEKNMYSTSTYKTDKIKFPIKLKMLQVDDDQFIGVTSAKFLMKLREAQLINYNADTQRALEIMVNNGKEIFRPFVSNINVQEIKNLYASKSFIPNTISLNISLDDEQAEYSYNEENCELRISNITAFDIFDGYHRYLGMAENYDLDNSFDYPMELRITMFSVERAKQFIWQEDHKTKMKRIDAATFDQYNPGNIIIKRINSDADFDLNNNIGLQDDIIHAGILSEIINKLYFPKRPERKQIIDATRKIKIGINNFVEEYEKYMEERWNKYETLLIIYGIYKEYTPDKIHAAIQSANKIQINYINKVDTITKRVIDMLKEVYSNV